MLVKEKVYVKFTTALVVLADSATAGPGGCPQGERLFAIFHHELLLPIPPQRMVQDAGRHPILGTAASRDGKAAKQSRMPPR